jgi:hypothetical protein
MVLYVYNDMEVNSMPKYVWTKWKNHQGFRYIGTLLYNPEQPLSVWEKIMGVVARCEGRHDTVVSYDATGITWGFMQWTFTSGRLQKLLESFKSIQSMDFVNENNTYNNLFDDLFVINNGRDQVFESFGFKISGGKFVDCTSGIDVILNPAIKKDKKRIDDICMGRVHTDNPNGQRLFALNLARLFGRVGTVYGVPEAQTQFAINEFKRSLRFSRRPLDGMTIGELLDGTWDTPLPAVFFNLWQNHPANTYRMFKSTYKYIDNNGLSADEYFNIIWNKLNRSKFANWSYAKKGNKSPRIFRIKKAIKEFYDIDLKVIR